MTKVNQFHFEEQSHNKSSQPTGAAGAGAGTVCFPIPVSWHFLRRHSL
jgi:hypothetical protein